MQALNGIQATIDCRLQCKYDDLARPLMETARTKITSFLQLPMLDDCSKGHLYFGTQSDVFSLFTRVAIFFWWVLHCLASKARCKCHCVFWNWVRLLTGVNFFSLIFVCFPSNCVPCWLFCRISLLSCCCCLFTSCSKDLMAIYRLSTMGFIWQGLTRLSKDASVGLHSAIMFFLTKSLILHFLYANAVEATSHLAKDLFSLTFFQ